MRILHKIKMKPVVEKINLERCTYTFFLLFLCNIKKKIVMKNSRMNNFFRFCIDNFLNFFERVNFVFLLWHAFSFFLFLYYAAPGFEVYESFCNNIVSLLLLLLLCHLSIELRQKISAYNSLHFIFSRLFRSLIK